MWKLALTIILILLTASSSAQEHPKAFRNAGQLAAWAQMKADYDANPANPTTTGGKWYKLIKANADCDCRSFDGGIWDSLIYAMSGDAAYAAKAYTKVSAKFSASPTDRNARRENGWRWAVMYDWLYDYMSPEQRALYLNWLNGYASAIDTYWSSASYWPVERVDSDQVTGEYLFVALWYALTGTYNPTVATIWGHSWTGGYTSTYASGTLPTTARDAISYYIDMAGGGEWIETDEYNLNTVKYLLATKAIEDVSGSDLFPEVTAWYPDHAARIAHQLTPDLREAFKWGTSEKLLDPMWYYRIEVMMAAIGRAPTSTGGKRLQGLLAELVNKYGACGAGCLDPVDRGFYVYDPYSEALPYTDTPNGDLADWGIFNYRTGWTDTDSFLGAVFIGPYRVDHQPRQTGSFRLYKNREWIFNYGHSYSGVTDDARGSNGLTIDGLPAFLYGPGNDYSKVQASKFDAVNGFAYVTGTAGGSVFNKALYAPPNIYFHEHTRSLVYIPELQAIVVHDRTNGDAPIHTSSTPTNLKTWIDSRTHRKELYVHMPVSPTVDDTTITWPLTINGTAKVFVLKPTTPVFVTENESSVYVSGYYGLGDMYASEKKWHTIVSPNSNNKWDTFLTVWTHYTGTPLTVVNATTTGDVDAGVLSNGSMNRVCVFNSLQGADLQQPTGSGYRTFPTTANHALLDSVRKKNSSYQVVWSSGGLPTKVLLFDLDPTILWTYSLNSGAPQDLTIASDGIGVIDTALTGTVTLDILSGGLYPVIVTTGSLPDGKKNSAYSQQLVCSGGNGSECAWSKTVGSFQTGISISEAGLISGTPTVAGSETFTIQACDTQPACGTREFTLVIADLPSITTTSLPNGAVGLPYDQSLDAVGGTTPYTWAITSGTLCDGLSMSAAGVITGTPTIIQTCIFTVEVTDDDSQTDEIPVSIRIASALSSISVTAAPGTVTVVVTHTVPYLDYFDSCSVSLLDGQAVLGTVTTTEGSASRMVTFSDLIPDKSFGVDVVCGTAIAPRTFFRTLAYKDSGVRNWKYTLTPHARLVARGAVKVSVEYNIIGEAADTETASCATGCTLTLPLTSGSLYEIRHIWKTSGDAVVATSKVGTVAVP